MRVRPFFYYLSAKRKKHNETLIYRELVSQLLGKTIGAADGEISYLKLIKNEPETTLDGDEIAISVLKNIGAEVICEPS